MIDDAVEALRAAVDGLLALDLCAESSAAVTAALVDVEIQKRRLAAVDVGLLVQVRDRRIAAEHCRASVADLLVELVRVTPAEARARVLAAEDLGPRVTVSGQTLEPSLPRVAQALTAGEISPGHVAVIGRAMDRLPGEIGYEAGPVAEQLLLEAARHEHPRRLEQTARLLHARLDPDGPEPREATARAQFTMTRHASGWSTARGTLDPATSAAVGAVLDTLSAPLPSQDGTPDPRPAAQRRHDGLYEMARRLLNAADLPASGGVPTTIILTTPELQPDIYATGSRAETVRLRELQPCGDVACGAEIVQVRVDAAGAPLSLGRTRRLATLTQRLALIARDRGCTFPGCDRPPAWTEAHHVIAWHDGGHTNLDNLCLVCAFHHREFTRRGWAVRIAADHLPEWLPPSWLDPDRRPRRNRAHQPPDFARPAPDPP